MHKIHFKYQLINYQGQCAVEFCLHQRSITLDANTKMATVHFNNKDNENVNRTFNKLAKLWLLTCPNLWNIKYSSADWLTDPLPFQFTN
jgi:hypothetical protein